MLGEVKYQIVTSGQFYDDGLHTYPSANRQLKTFRELLQIWKRPGDFNFEEFSIGRLAIARNLTRALTYLYKTGMMTRPWTEDTIEFLVLESKQKWGTPGTVTYSHPMIAAPQLPADAPYSDPEQYFLGVFQQPPLEQKGPKFPEIKAIGVLLIQLLTNKTVEKLIAQYPLLFDENGVVTERGRKAFNAPLPDENIETLDERKRPIREVMRKCFGDDLLPERVNTMGDSTLDFEGEHLGLKEEISVPLRVLMKEVYPEF